MRAIFPTSALLLLCASSALAAAKSPLSVSPRSAQPGDVVVVTVRSEEADPPPGEMGSAPLHFSKYGKGFIAFFAIPLEHTPGTLEAKVQSGGQELKETLEVLPAHFRESELKVAQKFVDPSAEDKAKMAEDKKALALAYGTPFSPLRFAQGFRWPRPNVITAPYGDRRMFNGSLQSQHYGTDLEGKVGVPVWAANAGQVVLSRGCFASGNTVVIHHGADLFTAYFHLSKIEVKEGQTVKRGQRLGLVGKTGRVTGPHLHWATKVGERYVNPESLFKLPFR